MLWEILELDVLAFLLPILIKVPVEVRSVPIPPFALAAAVLIPAGDILPLVVAGVSGGDALVCGTTLVLIVALKIRCDSALQFFLDASLELL